MTEPQPTAGGDVRPAVAPAAPADTLMRDLPCDRCGYNLRGLSAWAGKCPECALPVAASRAAEEARNARHRPPTPGEARAVVDGAAFLLGGFAVLAVVAGTFPEVMFRRWSPGRYVVLGLLSAAWTAWGFGAWRLCVPSASRSAAGRAGMWVARVILLAYFVVPFVWAVETWNQHAYFEPRVSWWWRLVAALPAVAVVPMVVAAAMKRVRSTAASALGLLSAAGTPAAMFMIIFAAPTFGPGSLDVLMTLPYGPFVTGEIVALARRARVWDEPIFYLVLAPAVLNVTLLVWLWRAYRPIALQRPA